MRMLLVLIAGLAFAQSGAQRATPRLIYSKSFPGSAPAYVEIRIERSGASLYQEEKIDDDPMKFQLSQTETSQLFDLADKLDHFTHPLESGLKVAKMGEKTFRYEGDGEPHEVKFNYSENPDAKALNDLFEQIAETERALIDLERAVRFDKLGAQDAILRIEILRDEKHLMAPEQFLPMLDRVAKNESFIHMARDRAATLADGIRNSK